MARRIIVIVGAWWALMMLLSIPAAIALVRDTGSAAIEPIASYALAGFLLGPQSRDPNATWAAIFGFVWPAYVVMMNKLLSGDWRFRSGLLPSVLAAAASTTAALAVSLVGLASEGLLTSETLAAAPEWLLNCLFVFAGFFVTATLANGLSALLLQRRTAGRASNKGIQQNASS